MGRIVVREQRGHDLLREQSLPGPVPSQPAAQKIQWTWGASRQPNFARPKQQQGDGADLHHSSAPAARCLWKPHLDEVQFGLNLFDPVGGAKPDESTDAERAVQREKVVRKGHGSRAGTPNAEKLTEQRLETLSNLGDKNRHVRRMPRYSAKILGRFFLKRDLGHSSPPGPFKENGGPVIQAGQAFHNADASRGDFRCTGPSALNSKASKAPITQASGGGGGL